MAIVAPKEGVLAFEQSFNLPKSAKDKSAAHQYVNYLASAAAQERMARTFYTSPCNQKSIVDPKLAQRLPITGSRMTEIKSYDWDSYVPRAAAIADRWNREMA